MPSIENVLDRILGYALIRFQFLIRGHWAIPLTFRLGTLRNRAQRFVEPLIIEDAK